MLRQAVALTVVGLLCSCSSARKQETAAEAPETIVPVEKDYRVSFDAAWSTVEDMLEQNGMPIELTDKDNGVVITGFMGGDVDDGDFVEKETPLAGHGRRWIEETRYKLRIQLVPLSDEQTRIQITAFIQGKYSWASARRYREGSWYDMLSTGGVEQNMHEELVARLGDG